MIEPPIGVRVVRSKTRCHPYITDLQTFYAVTTAAVASHLGTISNDADVSHMVLAARATHADVALPLAGYVESAISGQVPDEIIIRIENKEPEPEGVGAPRMEGISHRIVAAVFSLFIDTGLDWLCNHYKKPVADWPPVCNFCRVVRNAIVHGGKINIDSPTAIGASWRHLHYDHRHNGRTILNQSDLSSGDLIVLMLEMEAALNDLGAPFDLG